MKFYLDRECVVFQKAFRYGSGSRGTLHYPDEKAPVVFRLRKRGETTFLLSGGKGRLLVEAPEEGSERTSLVPHSDWKHYDFEYAARHFPEEKRWHVTFRCLDRDGGVLFSTSRAVTRLSTAGWSAMSPPIQGLALPAW